MQPKQKHFNTVLSSTRVIIEQNFGYLKERFRRLKLIESLDYVLVSHTAVATAVLYNICKISAVSGNRKIFLIHFMQFDKL